MSFVKMSTQELNFLFEGLTDASHRVIWVRSPDYKRQLYLSDSFENVWQMPNEVLYKNPDAWNESLIGNNRDEFITFLKNRKPNQNQEETKKNNIILYRIHLVRDQGMAWIKDSTFYLYNDLNEQVAVAGIAEAISQAQWELELARCYSLESDQTETMKDRFFKTLEQELKLTVRTSSHMVLLDEKHPRYRHIVTQDGIRIKLSKSELV